jgi:hypothetical protein
MSSIKFNHLTREISIKGSESFIESNYQIQDLLIESFGVKKKMTSIKTKEAQEPVLNVRMKESQANAEIKKPELSDALPALPVTEPSIPEKSHELKTNRPPLRKYIRKVGIPGCERTLIEVVEQKPSIISIDSLKEKFGLSESKIEGIIRDAERLGKVRRVMNGSYVWK